MLRRNPPYFKREDEARPETVRPRTQPTSRVARGLPTLDGGSPGGEIRSDSEYLVDLRMAGRGLMIRPSRLHGAGETSAPQLVQAQMASTRALGDPIPRPEPSAATTAQMRSTGARHTRSGNGLDQRGGDRVVRFSRNAAEADAKPSTQMGTGANPSTQTGSCSRPLLSPRP